MQSSYNCRKFIGAQGDLGQVEGCTSYPHQSDWRRRQYLPRKKHTHIPRSTYIWVPSSSRKLALWPLLYQYASLQRIGLDCPRVACKGSFFPVLHLLHSGWQHHSEPREPLAKSLKEEDANSSFSLYFLHSAVSCGGSSCTQTWGQVQHFVGLPIYLLSPVSTAAT